MSGIAAGELLSSSGDSARDSHTVVDVLRGLFGLKSKRTEGAHGSSSQATTPATAAINRTNGEAADKTVSFFKNR
jgi:hypothetical protein